MDVLESKLRVPRVHASTVRRDHLLRRMARGEQRGYPIAIVSAPAGAGKTTVLAQRTEQLRSAGAAVAWLSIDSDDNDPCVLLSGLLAASLRAIPEPKSAAKRGLAALSAPDAALAETFVGAWCSALEALPGGIWLMLDDVHRLDTGPGLDVVARILTEAPPWLRVTLGCRHIPPPLSSVLASGAALELTVHDLAFDRAETNVLLRGNGVELADADLDVMLDRTEGWAAALRLAAMSLERQQDKSSYIAAMAGDDRAIAGYLLSEVLAAQRPEVMAFLQATSVPEWLTGELAEVLSGRPDAPSILDQLVEDNVLVFRNDSSPPSYRYHPLLRDYLIAELDRQDAAAQRMIHLRASDWFLSHGHPRAALAHATSAADWTRVGATIGRFGLPMLLAGDRLALSRALARYPVTVAEPSAGFVAAIAALAEGNLAIGRHWLDLLGRDPSSQGDPRLRALHTAAVLMEARLSGDRSPQIVSLARAGSPGDIDDPDLELVVTAARGELLVELAEFVAGEAALAQAYALARRTNRDLIALDCLSRMTMSAAALNQFDTTRSHAEQAIEFASSRGWASAPQMVPTYLMAAWAAWQTMDITTAERYADACVAVDIDLDPAIHLSVEYLRAHIRFEKGSDIRELLDRLRLLWHDDHVSIVSPTAVSNYCLHDLRTALWAGRDDWIDEIIERSRALLGDAPDAGVIVALVHARRGDLEAARRALDPVIADGLSCLNMAAEITAWLLDAHLALGTGELDRARSAVVRAVSAAAPVPGVRDVASAPADVLALLREDPAGSGDENRDFVTTVLRVVDRPERMHAPRWFTPEAASSR